MGLIIAKPFWRCLRVVVLAAMTTVTAFSASAAVSVTPITWNVVGLDSNNVSVGPNIFPVGVRVCNTGSTFLSGLKARFVWDSTSAYITRTSTEFLDVTNLVAGTCQDVFHEVTVTRDAAAYAQVAGYHIDVIDGVNAVLASTPSPREIYVERLISQNRNSIDDILVNNVSVTPGSGSANVNEGQTYEVKLVAHTATQGYEQFQQFLNFRSDLFIVKSVKSTYTAAAGTDLLAGSKIYADGCQWVNDPTDVTSPAYRECQSTGKYGGSTTVTYVVEIKAGAGALAPGGVSINALLYDFSGNSYHYNADHSDSISFNITSNTPPAEVDLAMAKSAVLSSPGNGQFILTVTNTGSIGATNVVVTDSVPVGYNIKNSQPAAPAGTTLVWDKADPDEGLVWTIPALPAGSSISYTFLIQTLNGEADYVNQACVTATETDPNVANNCATAAVPVEQSDLALVKTADFTSPFKIGDSITFNVGLLNLGPSVGTSVVVSDILPAGYLFTSASCASGWTLSSAGSTYSCTATSDVAVSAVPVTILSIVAQALAPADPAVTTGYENTASVVSVSNDPIVSNNQATAIAPPTFLTIAKTSSAPSYTSASPNGIYTLKVTKSGSPASLGVISVQDVLPLGVSATSINGVGWTCNLATVTCTRTDDLTSGIPPSTDYPDILIGATFSGPSNVLVNYANVISELSGVVSSYDETTQSVSWTNSAVHYTVGATASPGGGGSVACVPSSVLSGESSVCTATPNTGYNFTGWTGSCAGQSGLVCNLNGITANMASTASFAAVNYTVDATASPVGGGSVSCVPSSVLSGSSSVCTATPNTGYNFTGWTGSCAGQSGLVCNLSGITANMASTASFAVVVGSLQAIPTLSEWGMIIMVSLIVLAACATVRRKMS